MFWILLPRRPVSPFCSDSRLLPRVLPRVLPSFSSFLSSSFGGKTKKVTPGTKIIPVARSIKAARSLFLMGINLDLVLIKEGSSPQGTFFAREELAGGWVGIRFLNEPEWTDYDCFSSEEFFK